jgi:hypothetical protein
MSMRAISAAVSPETNDPRTQSCSSSGSVLNILWLTLAGIIASMVSLHGSVTYSETATYQESLRRWFYVVCSPGEDL